MTDISQQLITVLTTLVITLQSLSIPTNSPVPTPQPKADILEVSNSIKFNNELESVAAQSKVRKVPFYSQFNDITDPNWKKVGCGIAGVAMLIDYYAPAVSVDSLLNRGIASGAYLSNAGWTHAGLINLTKQYGLNGYSFDMASWSMEDAFSQLKQVVAEGPVMVSVYYTFVPGHPIPHLVVVNDIKGDTVYYNDPAEPTGGGSISVEKFKPAWKKRYIEIRPV